MINLSPRVRAQARIFQFVNFLIWIDHTAIWLPVGVCIITECAPCIHRFPHTHRGFSGVMGDVQVNIANGIATITFNRPESLNAITSDGS